MCANIEFDISFICVFSSCWISLLFRHCEMAKCTPYPCRQCSTRDTNCLSTFNVHHFDDLLLRPFAFGTHIAIACAHQIADGLVAVDEHSCCCVLQCGALLRNSPASFLQLKSCMCVRNHLPFVASAAHHVYQINSTCLSLLFSVGYPCRRSAAVLP